VIEGKRKVQWDNWYRVSN